jgi:hypothetical protein
VLLQFRYFPRYLLYHSDLSIRGVGVQVYFLPAYEYEKRYDMTAMGRPIVPPQVNEVEVCDCGVIITFNNNQRAFFDAEYLFDHQDVSSNFPMDDDTFDA